MSSTTCATPTDTEALGRELARSLRPGDLVLLEGDLAAGKTTLVRGLTAGLDGDPDEVTSPTFVLVQTYPCAGAGIRRLHHVDLYRLEERRRDLRELGLEEMLSEPDAVVAIEWPKATVLDWLPPDAQTLRIVIEVAENGHRRITTETGHPHP